MADSSPNPDRPLSIALLGWAMLSLQAREGSGYNLNASELGASLAARGHKVSYLRAGVEFSLRPGIFIRRVERWRGVECFHLYNSPNFAHAWFNFHNIAKERASPPTCDAVLNWLRSIRADVVHVHSLEGLSLDLPAAIRSAGIPVVITPHNHWYLCPEVDLLYQDKEICTDYDGGRRCESCIRSWPPARWRAKQRLTQDVRRLLGEAGVRALDSVDNWRKSIRAGLTGRPVTAPDTALSVMDPRGDDIPPDQNERFLAARDVHLRVLNEYGRRRTAGIEALTSANLVIPPSEWLTRLLVSLGVPIERCRRVKLGQPHFDALHAAAEKSPGFDRPPWTPGEARPLRLGYLGTTKHNKGLHVLAAAAACLSHEVLARTEFVIHAAGPDPPVRRLLESMPNVRWRGPYPTSRLAEIFETFDVGLHPHVGFDNSPFILLEYLNSGKFTLVSRLGGPMEWIREGVNGLLFSPGSANGNQLALLITDLVEGRIAIPPPRTVRGAVELRSHAGHVAEVEAIYREVRGDA